MSNNVIYTGDVIDGLKTFEDKCARVCVTSPPYYGKRNYDMPGQIGLEKTPEEYVYKMVQVFREVRRTLTDDGTLWLNLGDSYWGGKGKSGAQSAEVMEKRNHAGKAITKKYMQLGGPNEVRITDGKHPTIKPKDMIGIPWAVATALRDDGADHKTCTAINNALQRIKAAFSEGMIPARVEAEIVKLEEEYSLAKGNGWYLRQDIIWSKTNPMPESIYDRCANAHEYFFLLSKNGRKPMIWRHRLTREWVWEKPAAMSDEAGKRLWDSYDYFYDHDALKEPLKEASIRRLGQDVSQQEGSVVPGRKNGKMKAVYGGHKYEGKDISTYSGRPFESTGYANKKSVWEMPDDGAMWAFLFDNLAPETADDLFQKWVDGAQDKTDVWRLATKSFKEAHFAVFPEKLIRPAIIAGSLPGDTVLDPFMGSGTTAREAQELDRYYKGCELNPAYMNMKQKLQVKRFGLFA